MCPFYEVNMYTVYTRDGCDLCTQAIQFLEDHKLDYRTIEINTKEDVENAKSFVPSDIRRGRVQLPIILDENQKYIGGKDELILVERARNACK